MMVVDGSVIVAIAKDEPDARALFELLEASPSNLMSAGNLQETFIVLIGLGVKEVETRVQRILDECAIVIVPVDEALARLAADAFSRFGKGRHPAKLNFGDCFAYALARARGLPLLFKGGDFSQTDIPDARIALA
ncbi:type II toxin-antitoxin system VapC family toxin [Terrarubrum flagellatum]|uniref:type II toxin-antitoxin system VapC family toxin n=1 Tax=Terrirubrum flagellatum TaxID=2895980 RepID=UPI00314545E7